MTFYEPEPIAKWVDGWPQDKNGLWLDKGELFYQHHDPLVFDDFHPYSPRIHPRPSHALPLVDMNNEFYQIGADDFWVNLGWSWKDNDMVVQAEWSIPGYSSMYINCTFATAGALCHARNVAASALRNLREQGIRPTYDNLQAMKSYVLHIHDAAVKRLGAMGATLEQLQGLGFHV